MNLCYVVSYTISGHVKLEFQCYFKCIYLDLAVVNIVEGGIDMVDTTQTKKDAMKTKTVVNELVVSMENPYEW